MLSIRDLERHLKDWTVLVVDDDTDSINIAATLLTMIGTRVLTASNGQTGLQKAIEYRPQFIISDLSMPYMSGWEMLQALKENLATRDIPVIALTAHAMQGDRNRAIAAGFHNYLTKPLRPETFVRDLLTLLIDSPEIMAALLETSPTNNSDQVYSGDY
jgi:CheY-like chemotaxis protein